MSEKLKGGLSDDKSLRYIAQKHAYDDSTDSTSKEKIEKMLTHLKSQLEMGKKVELEHTNDIKRATEIAMDHLDEDPNYYTKLKKIETKEQTMASSAGAYVGPLFGTKKNIVKRKITKIPNFTTDSKTNINEQGVQTSGEFDVPAFGKTTKGGRKNPLKIDGVKSIKKSRAVTDPKFPKWGGPKSVFIKIKEKCKKFPYCNQGDINAIELLEDKDIKDSIIEVSKNTGVPYKELEKIVLKEINKIFI